MPMLMLSHCCVVLLLLLSYYIGSGTCNRQEVCWRFIVAEHAFHFISFEKVGSEITLYMSKDVIHHLVVDQGGMGHDIVRLDFDFEFPKLACKGPVHHCLSAT
jgi:hypothetical protein